MVWSIVVRSDVLEEEVLTTKKKMTRCGKARTVRYIPVRQLIGMRTGRYRAVLVKATVDGRLKEKSAVSGRLRKIKGRGRRRRRGKEERRRGKEPRPRALTARGRPRAVAARGRLFSLRGERDRDDRRVDSGSGRSCISTEERWRTEEDVKTEGENRGGDVPDAEEMQLMDSLL
ncbi:hypothetical protein GW17_00015887 [Ensete ventricosum]|nr:hypothetical protein GW17_00015887 [Ensete ventricosum]